jgi:hypothetical protein
MREAVSIMARVSAKCVVSRNRGHIVIHEPREKHVRALPGVRTQCDRFAECDKSRVAADGSVRRIFTLP